jgi:hypothetical protein
MDLFPSSDEGLKTRTLLSPLGRSNFSHWITYVRVRVRVTLQLTVSQSVRLGVEPRLGLMTRYLFLYESCHPVYMGRPLWREDGSVVCQSVRNNVIFSIYIVYTSDTYEICAICTSNLCQYNYSYINTWGEALSMGDNMKMYNKNCAEAHRDLKLRY